MNNLLIRINTPEDFLNSVRKFSKSSGKILGEYNRRKWFVSKSELKHQKSQKIKLMSKKKRKRS